MLVRQSLGLLILVIWLLTISTNFLEKNKACESANVTIDRPYTGFDKTSQSSFGEHVLLLRRAIDWQYRLRPAEQIFTRDVANSYLSLELTTDKHKIHVKTKLRHNRVETLTRGGYILRDMIGSLW